MKRMDRRTFLTTLAAAATGSLTGAAWARETLAAPATAAAPAKPAATQAAPAVPELIERNAWPEHWETSLESLGRTWLTPNDRFFVRNHLPAPEIDPATHKLEIRGLVRLPLTLSLADLQAMPPSSVPCTLECAGNGRALFDFPSTAGTQWERGAVGNAHWAGVSLLALLRRAEVSADAKHVWFEAADRSPHPDTPPFLRSIPIEKAMNDVLLAWSMNGEPLPRLHGGPLRAIVPGWFAMASTKWVTRIRLERDPSDNHFMAKGYRYNAPGEDPLGTAPVEEMKVKSVITRPLDGATVALGKVRIQGLAWAGPKGLRMVEISTDGGTSWKPAGFMGDHEPMTWRIWATQVEVKEPARLTVMARATDGNGVQQPLVAPINAGGYGNNSIHSVSFRVRA
jgi:DMSO/TMAO reductase YedYZ molybdopterin-dependent catalytic subunit